MRVASILSTPPGKDCCMDRLIFHCAVTAAAAAAAAAAVF
jgi:hypothetical protein